MSDYSAPALWIYRADGERCCVTPGSPEESHFRSVGYVLTDPPVDPTGDDDAASVTNAATAGHPIKRGPGRPRKER